MAEKKKRVDLEEQARRATHFRRLVDWIARPGQVLAEVLQEPAGAWRLPLMVLSLFAALQVLTAAPLIQAEIAQNPAPLPQDFQYYPPEMQEQYLQALETTSGAAFTHVVPLVLGLAQVWISWLLVGGLLFLLLTLMGVRTTAKSMLALAAWSSLPYAVRYLVRIGSMLVAGARIGDPGISGFVNPLGSPGAQLFHEVAANIDLYLLWQIGLVILGLSYSEQNHRFKRWAGTLITFVLLLLLLGLPGYLGERVGSMTIIRPYF